jgi:hypothetical protein
MCIYIYIYIQKRRLKHKLLSTSFHKSLQHQISRKSFQWVPNCYMRRDRRTEGQRNTTTLICAFLYFTNAYNAAYASFLSLSFSNFMSDLKDNTRTIEISCTPAISYLNDVSVLPNLCRKLFLYMSNGHRFHLPILHILLALCLTKQKENFAFCY